MCAVETQLTRQAAPIVHGWGVTEPLERAALRVEEDAAVNPVASAAGIVLLVPNRAAVDAGARRWLRTLGMAPPSRASQPAVPRGDRGVVVGWTADHAASGTPTSPAGP